MAVLELVYPTTGRVRPAIVPRYMYYERDMNELHETIQAQHKAIEAWQKADELAETTAKSPQSWWQRQMLAQGPWDEINDRDFVKAFKGEPELLKCARLLPKSVANRDSESPDKSFSRYAKGKHDPNYPQGEQSYKLFKAETTFMNPHAATRLAPCYGIYAPRSKRSIKGTDGGTNNHEMVKGPCNIPKLLANLGKNGFVRHLLLGNNMIGLAGAGVLAQWTLNNPGNIETWYLAGNSIDAKGLQRLVGAWIFADNITNIWLRQNPLGPESAYMLSILIKNSPKLRTLDLDQTELGDQGVTELFGALLPLQTESGLDVKIPVPSPNSDLEKTYRATSLNPIWIKKRACGEEVPLQTVYPPIIINVDEFTYKSTVALRNIYLNAVGAGGKACWSIGLYLSHSLCPIESLYLCNNPLGHAGAIALAKGLASNQSLLRLNLASCGLKNKGLIAILEALKAHPQLRSLGMPQSYVTSELGSRYNFFDDGVKDALKAFIVNGPKTLRLFDLGDTAMSVPAIESLAADVTRSDSLVVFYAESIHGNGDKEVLARMKRKLDGNRQHLYGMDEAAFSKTERRWLMDPKHTDIINSACFNRDDGTTLHRKTAGRNKG